MGRRRREASCRKSVGANGQRIQNAEQTQAERPLHFRAQAWQEENLIFMGRSLKKGPFVESHLLEKIDKMNASGSKKTIKTCSRRSMVTPDFVSHTFLLHNC